ncbi:MAG: DUF4249 domain-containing protein [Tunicatimonas sp.]|uniref:DUF4249 domain-containing protein n=1 Tax=Tunicatimonas sp. TaxID=1940096 RepID=UPI003C75EAAE
MKRTLIVGTIGILVLVACQKDIEIDIAQEAPRLAIYSMLQPDSLVSVWVSHSKSVTDASRIRAVTEAQVIVSSDQGLVETLTLVDSMRGQYRANFAPQPGVAYHLSVTAESYPPAEATTTVPIPVSLADVSYTIVPANKPTQYRDDTNFADTVTRYAFALTFSDPASEKNYYMVSNALQYWGVLGAYQSSEGEWVTEYDTLETIASNHSVDPAVQDLESLTSEPYRGYQDYYFTDELFNGLEYTFDYKAEVDEAFPLSMVVTLTTYHEDAYQYVRTSWQQEYFDDLLFEIVPLAQNIKGGYGIFGSFSYSRVIVELN